MVAPFSLRLILQNVFIVFGGEGMLNVWSEPRFMDQRIAYRNLLSDTKERLLETSLIIRLEIEL
jgi:hypothetical protein